MLLRDTIAHALLLAAEIVYVIPWQNRSIVQKGITRKSQSLKKDTEPQVKF